MLRLPVQQTQHGTLCPIWLHQPRALHLRSPARGTVAAVVCVSARLVQQTQEAQRPEQLALSRAASSQVKSL